MNRAYFNIDGHLEVFFDDLDKLFRIDESFFSRPSSHCDKCIHCVMSSLHVSSSLVWLWCFFCSEITLLNCWNASLMKCTHQYAQCGLSRPLISFWRSPLRLASIPSLTIRASYFKALSSTHGYRCSQKNLYQRRRMPPNTWALLL